MQIAVNHYMVKEPVMTKRRRSEKFAPAQGSFSLFDVDFFRGDFVLLLLLMDAADPAAGAAAAVAAGAAYAALVFNKLPDGEENNEQNDRADKNITEVVLDESKHSDHLLIQVRSFF